MGDSLHGPASGADVAARASQLAARVLSGDRAAIAAALSLCEDTRDAARAETVALVRALAPHARAHAVGLTGPPGAGKSTLAQALAGVLRGRGKTLGILAVDPSSQRSGGALLGDRARMTALADDDGAFVRSVATHGALGGLSASVSAQMAVLGAAFDVALLETTGVGQTETDVARVVDTVCVVVQPGSGDVLQFLKAGVMEIPDLVVVTKADHEALARRATADLAAALRAIESVGAGAVVPVIATSAQSHLGLDALADALDAHLAQLVARGELALRRRRGAAAEGIALLVRRHGEHALAVLGIAEVRALAAAGAERGEPAAAIGEHLVEAFRKAAGLVY